jgi:hypothetical protein
VTVFDLDADVSEFSPCRLASGSSMTGRIRPWQPPTPGLEEAAASAPTTGRARA